MSPDSTLEQLGIDDVQPSLTTQEKQATVRELLAARSGVYRPALYETANQAHLRPARGSHAPGTFWYYNNWDFNAVGTIYERAVGRSIFAALLDRIARPIGMQDYRPADGRYVTGPESSMKDYPVRMNARDLARFGLLYLREGRWSDRPIVPSSWVKTSTTPLSKTPGGLGYALLWWTAWGDHGAPIMGLPAGAFWAEGVGGQFVVIDPEDDLVVVHQTDGDPVYRSEFGHLMLLIRSAASGHRSPG
jgi:CubicO group peptidase (beta-lactamase class C family)